MLFQTQPLLRALEAQVQQFLSFAEGVNALKESALTQRPHPHAWKLLECLEHLNLYGDFYLPAVEEAIQAAPPATEEAYRSGWLGAYFVKSMLPKEGSKKMKTFKDKDPLGTSLDRTAITRFTAQQHQWLHLLRAAERVSLQHTKVPLSIAPWLKLRLGDVLRFVMAHQERHQVQMQRLQGQAAPVEMVTP